jgi:hypothetical protein
MWCRKRGGTGGGDRGGPAAAVAVSLQGAAGAAHGCWGRKGGPRSDRGGRGQGDGSVNEGEAQDAVAGSWRAALGSSVVDVEGGCWGAWSTGRWRFQWTYSG